MLPQYGSVPNYRMRISGPAWVMLTLVILTGGMLALSFHLYSEGGVEEVRSRIILTLLATGVLAVFILLAATHRFWQAHLWADAMKRRAKKRKRRADARHRHR